MSRLDEAVGKATRTYRTVFFVSGVIAIVSLLVKGQIVAALGCALIYGMTYHLGLAAVGYLLAKMIPKSVLFEEFRSRKIEEINRRLDEGTLEAGTEELETMMVAAGLEPLHIVVEHGPTFGRQFDSQMYEWLDAKKGLKGEVLRYTYVGHAEFDDDGCLVSPNEEGMFMSQEGFLYKHTPEPKKEDVQ